MQGARTVSFRDDTGHQRFKRLMPEGTTLYIAAFVIARSEATKQSILSFCGEMDCVAYARNDVEGACIGGRMG
jgi:hypothetical protein